MSLYTDWFGSTPFYRAQSWRLLGLAVLVGPLYVAAMVYLKLEGRWTTR